MSKKHNDIELQILQASYWEHYKHEKDLHYILPIDHPKFQIILNEMNQLTDRINQLKNPTK